MTASGFVAFESLKYSTPAAHPTGSSRCSTGLNDRAARPRVPRAAPRRRAAAASRQSVGRRCGRPGWAAPTPCSTGYGPSARVQREHPVHEAGAAGLAVARRLTRHTRARRERATVSAHGAEPSSSTSITAKSSPDPGWRRPGPCRPRSASRDPCQSRWSGVMFRSTATRGQKSLGERELEATRPPPRAPSRGRPRRRLGDRRAPDVADGLRGHPALRRGGAR